MYIVVLLEHKNSLLLGGGCLTEGSFFIWSIQVKVLLLFKTSVL